MPDVHDSATRSRNMAAIKGKNTKPELLIRSMLHRHGFRYRIHDKLLPGKPDLVFPKYNAAIFVHGCFWHGHNCHLFKVPGSRTEFWLQKISQNRDNDARSYAGLRQKNYRILTIWECALKGKTRLLPNMLYTKISEWIMSKEISDVIEGNN